MTLIRALTVIAAVGFVATEASGHARLSSGSTVLIPRSTNAGLKTGPCGGIPRTTTPTTLKAGDTITVNWEETIQHPGRFEFSFSPANDTGFVLLKTVPDIQDNPNTLPHLYTTTLTVPTTPCTGCTMQMIQVMTENPANPTFYYSCADVNITVDGAPPTGPIAPAPTPAPTPCQP